MAIDFFERQDVARKKTGWLVFLFILAVMAIIAMVYVVVVLAFGYAQQSASPDGRPPTTLDHLHLLAIVTVCMLLVIGGGSLYKIAQLRGGGTVIAESLGGQPIHPDANDPTNRKLLNVVEEMAIASGMSVPPVYLLADEKGINAFAAGYSPDDAVIGVTKGTAERLTRNQLQGVIAHEFGHILNGDMRLNIRLIGVLHGILIIGIIGYFILRSAFYSGHRRSRSSKSRGNPLPLIALGAGLMVVGAVGTFFGNLIKAAVSRQREFLADASAVQFTRQPDGIAGALKKIGGFSAGSRIESPNAPEASHMFFGEGISSALSFLFSTHPPLAERIRRILPSWDGEFVEGVADRLIPTGTAVSGLAGASARAARPKAPLPGAISHIGQPTQAHIAYAAELVATLPPIVATAAREPYGARAVIYALLINRKPEPRKVQLERLARHADRGVCDETQKLLPITQRLEARVRLPLIDMAIGALRALSPSQYKAFKQNVVELVQADQKISLFEWALQRILLRHLEPQFTQVKPPQVQYYGLRRLRGDCEVLLSTLAWVGQREPEQARQAFEAAISRLKLPQAKLQPADQCGLKPLDGALDNLQRLAPRIKRQVLSSCAHCISADRTVMVREAELFRAIGDFLGCPVPPLLPGQPLA